MRREKGFTMIEVLVAITVLSLVVAATLGTLTNALQATEAVGLMADTQQNLRAGLNYMARDFLQTGEGIPLGGITIPNTSGTSALNRPGPGTPAASFGLFNTTWTALPAIIPGYQSGPTTSTSGVATDMVTLLYADTTLVDASGHWLNEYPIFLSAGSGTAGCAATNPTPAPAGSIVTAGTTTTVTFDSSCIVINNGNTGLSPGDLILLQNNNTLGDGSITGTDTATSDSTGHLALLCVSSVNTAANSITFRSGDAFWLNASGASSGTIAKIQSPPGSGTYPTTTATRIWMITYFIDNSNPSRPELMRQVNLKQPQAVGEVIENMQLYYDILNAGSSPVTVSAGQENPTQAQLPDIRDAYIILYARSENPFSKSKTYFRNNLETVVSIRGLDFYNEFQ
jgi:prepilin-type N-terminal cleavage/methylation domain-containing protein